MAENHPELAPPRARPSVRLGEWLRQSFHIQYSGVVAPLFVGLGAFAVSVERFTFAYICFGVAGLWGLVWLWTLPRGTISQRLSLALRLGSTLVIAGIVGTTCALTASYRQQKELESDSGILVPANDPMPTYTCLAPPGAFVMNWGGAVSYRTDINASMSPTLTMGKATIFALKLDSDTGQMTIAELQLFDDRGQVLAAIGNNKIRLLNSAFRDRPDQSTLIIYDHLNREVLHIRYLNKRAISLRGIFNYPGLPPIEFNDHGIILEGATVAPVCILPLPGPRAPNSVPSLLLRTPNGNIELKP